ncbi:xanthine dehydrogenase accessory protein XdhC [Actibacterium sp. 188UL27-1]|uniref:xanthine dehydrogenase accessory protein XdhC n=1 Tax=Actibacterium sp. 188UL27-1 TaxID=2786961 RepID=UPI0019588045|nr:xanthine dehydrogenase accessory protein XdhC [Actibacterium sp. 188UL27-1]MBM7066635.1 xanthine dehydrogenase accessory protein XdhC [Actibacterium sp. 188UL27-1]
MSFNLNDLQAAVVAHGTVARVLMAEVKGSTPREAGAAMLVWRDGQSGTIGGGALEFDAAATARELLADGQSRVNRVPLGPALGQCCGGAVTLVTEIYDAAALAALAAKTRDGCVLRPLGGPKGDKPVALATAGPLPRLSQGWLAERLSPRGHPLWIYGAGHVGRALVATLAPLPGWAITWVDIAADRYPATVSPQVERLLAAAPDQVVHHAPAQAHHLIVTHSHDLDLALCHALLQHSFAFAGLIGSQTKWARFRSRLAALGHSDQQIARLTCPIGAPDLGKHPQAIAIGVAHALLQSQSVAHPLAEAAPR